MVNRTENPVVMPNRMEKQMEIPGLMIRQARREDLPDLEQLITLSVRMLCAADYGQRQIETFLEYGLITLDDRLVDEGTLFVADIDGMVVGCGGWSRRAATHGKPGDDPDGDQLLQPGRDSARIRLCFVHPEWSRRGIGRQLLETAEEAAREAGFTSLELAATHTGVKLYLSCGYEPVEDLEETLPNGVTLSGVRMTKHLPG